MFANISLGVKLNLILGIIVVLSSQEGADNYTLSLCHEIFMSNANMRMIYHGALTVCRFFSSAALRSRNIQRHQLVW